MLNNISRFARLPFVAALIANCRNHAHTYATSTMRSMTGIRILRVSSSRRSVFPTTRFLHMLDVSYKCDVEAEPIFDYCKGGYHPIHLGDTLGEGRYEILHKLGWGGCSTVWAARDHKTHNYVAVKVLVSEHDSTDRESTTLHTLAAAQTDHPGKEHLMTMQDCFEIRGPNGVHECFVTELLGPSFARHRDMCCDDGRLPGKVAKKAAKQALLGLSYLHAQGIAHGDLHFRNLSFTIPSVHSLSNAELSKALGEPEVGNINRTDRRPLGPGMPQYIVRPSVVSGVPLDATKIIDLGRSFHATDVPPFFHTPLFLRAPEIIFKDKVDLRMDLWSMGCMIFELVTGRPPFDSVNTRPTSLVSQMMDLTSDALPKRWKGRWPATKAASMSGNTGHTLQSWVEKAYLEGNRSKDFSQKDIEKVGAIVGRLLVFEPNARASAADVLRDSWFHEEY